MEKIGQRKKTQKFSFGYVMVKASLRYLMEVSSRKCNFKCKKKIMLLKMWQLQRKKKQEKKAV
jgi:hypothetical protein